MTKPGSIGVFDSGYGGLTILKEIVNKLPDYNYLYLGDSARSPYGNRSFDTVYQYTLQAVKWFFDQGCSLVILACNTASAKALRNIQQNDLPYLAPTKRVLGVIRPTTEIVGQYSSTNEIGILATQGTVSSNSYPIEIHKFFPEIKVYQQACPMWVPLVENNEFNSSGADFFIQQDLEKLFTQSHSIDTLLLACTHYPLLAEKIKSFLPPGVKLVSQGDIVASSLVDYLNRHPEIEKLCSKGSSRVFCTTDATLDFEARASLFFGQAIQSKHVEIEHL
jgi:glutamate racemase